MRQIIYASSAAVDITEDVLNDISSYAHQNNQSEELTGLLLYGDQMFFQVLEGPSEKIEKMKKIIWNDKRHKGLTEFKDSVISERSFPNWSMGCYRIGTTTDDDSQWPIVNLQSIRDRMPSTISPDIMVFAETFFQSIAPRSTR